MSTTSTAQTYILAHTAQCKLKLAVNRPDRNLRFALGHAFTFDNVMLQIARIEGMGGVAGREHSPEPHTDKATTDLKSRRVSFHDNAAKPSGELRGGGAVEEEKKGSGMMERRRSPPPTRQSHDSDPDTESDDEYEDLDNYENSDDDDEEEDPGMGLQRFVSASARPPRQRSPSPELEDEAPVSPPPVPSEGDLTMIMSGEGDDALQDLYESVRTCGCQDYRDGGKAVAIDRVWDVSADVRENMGERGLDVGAGGMMAVVRVKA